MALIILKSIGLSILGLLFIGWFKAITSNSNEKASFQKFVNDNLYSLVFSIIGIVLINSILILIPDVAELISTITGLTISSNVTNGSSFTLGIAIYSTVRNLLK